MPKNVSRSVTPRWEGAPWRPLPWNGVIAGAGLGASLLHFGVRAVVLVLLAGLCGGLAESILRRMGSAVGLPWGHRAQTTQNNSAWPSEKNDRRR